MACHVFDSKPLPEPMLTYYQLEHQERTSVKFVEKYSNLNKNIGHFVEFV